MLDAIEFFAKHSISDDFEPQINAILKLNEIPFQLSKGKLMNTFDTQINKNSLVSVQEVGLKELLQEASKYYDENNLQIAVEKLWDAFERLKTYYCSSTVDKKKSVNKIIMDMGNNQQPFLELFEKEFHELTILGNNFRIRHHETTKTDIQDKRHYEYFYKRLPVFNFNRNPVFRWKKFMIGMSFYQNLPVIDLYIIFPKLIMKLKKWRCAYEREI